jgi:S1-C subfamily serine protease
MLYWCSIKFLPGDKEPKMSRLSRFFPLIGGAVAGGVIALAVASGGSSTHSTTTTTVVQASRAPSIPTSFSGAANSSAPGLTINQIYRAASPGVVDIMVTSQSQGQTLNPFGGGGSQVTQGEGAGVVYDNKGDILTDEHVIAGAVKVTVTFQNGLKVPAKVLGSDPSTDVGVIRVNVPSSELHPIAFANSSDTQVGDPVVAIGSPFSLPETTTAGIVSQVGRSIMAPNNYTIPGAIQTDAAINPGNSGGPLLDGSGNVLGLNDQIETNNSTATGEGSSSGVGFAIPSDTVARIATAIIAGQTVQHSYVGVQLSGSSTGGAAIGSVQAGSPAQSAGLQTGDLITAINSQAITNTDQFIAMVDAYQPGQTITLTIKRGSQTISIKVKLGTRPAATPTGG